MRINGFYKNIKMENLMINEMNGNEPEEKSKKEQSLHSRIDMKFLDQRKIFLWGEVNDDSAKDIVSKLFYLESEKPGEPITFFIDSPGGVVSSGFSILDTMNLISSPVSTVCMGLAASMGSILLSGGVKGSRYIYPLGEVMIHQPSMGSLRATAADIEIETRQILKTKELSAKILSKNCGQTKNRIYKDFDRDHWMDSEESIKYGIVDKIYTI